MIKKRYLVMLTGLILIGLSISIYQYVETIKTGIASAADTKPAIGHSWSEMESDSDSIQVSGQTITNLAAPVNPTDAVNKTYADTVIGGGTYQACYVLNSSSGGVSCATGYTSLLHYTGPSASWIIDNVNGVTSATSYVVSVGGGLIEVSVSYCGNNYSKTQCEDGWQGNVLGILVPGTIGYASQPAISFGNDNIVRSTIPANTVQTFSLCCK